ncbi:ABC transporter ATP-binding protein [Halobellus sp. EA9]|uniref:ABC transporter ATP-binding protein n=1 Tax=Halobellus sp. EA9 TaxID=3421647 RepID=UPI003EBE8434
MSDVTLNGVEKEYPGGVLAVKGVTLGVEDGEFVTLVGPSGCGKTTTLRTIAGFEEPTAGVVGIDGVSVNDLPPDQRNTGMVFQDFALFPHMSVYENVEYGLLVDGVPEQERRERVEEMLELVELPGFGDRMPDQLSGGQQQRVALARALAPEPDVLLLDEPLASLDKKLRESMQIELQRIQREIGITTVLVTHNQEEALTMSDRVAVMNDGRLEQVGEPEAVYERPETRFVADFVGTANLFDGVVAEVGEEYTWVNHEGSLLAGVPQDQVEPGEDATIVLRPERAQVGAAVADGGPSKTAEQLTVEGTIETRRYVGDSVEYHLDVPEFDTEVIASASTEDSLREIGSSLAVTIDPDDCLVVTE